MFKGRIKHFTRPWSPKVHRQREKFTGTRKIRGVRGETDEVNKDTKRTSNFPKLRHPILTLLGHEWFVNETRSMTRFTKDTK